MNKSTAGVSRAYVINQNNEKSEHQLLLNNLIITKKKITLKKPVILCTDARHINIQLERAVVDFIMYSEMCV